MARVRFQPSNNILCYRIALERFDVRSHFPGFSVSSKVFPLPISWMQKDEVKCLRDHDSRSQAHTFTTKARQLNPHAITHVQ